MFLCIIKNFTLKNLVEIVYRFFVQADGLSSMLWVGLMSLRGVESIVLFVLWETSNCVWWEKYKINGLWHKVILLRIMWSKLLILRTQSVGKMPQGVLGALVDLWSTGGEFSLSRLTFDVTIVSYLRDYCLIVWYNYTSCSRTYRERIEINCSSLWQSLIMRIHENYCLVWVFWIFERF